MHIYYRSDNMDEPRFVYQRSEKYPGYVAVMAQFMPTFESQQPQDNKSINYTADEEEIEERDIDTDLVQKNIYTFIVDRSYSMQGTKMDITR